MSQDLQLTRRQIFDELTKIVDPEIGVSIMELELIDKVDIDKGKVNIDYSLIIKNLRFKLSSRITFIDVRSTITTKPTK